MRYKFASTTKTCPISTVSDLMSTSTECVSVCVSVYLWEGVCVCVRVHVRACLDSATKAMLHLSLFSRGAQNGRSEAAFIDNK